MQEIIDGKEIKRDSFVLYCDDYELITELSAEEKAALLDSIFLYEISRTEPEIEKGTSLKIVWKSIKGHLNRDWEKYKEKVQKLRENATKSKGESGEKAKADKSEQMQAKADKSEQIDSVCVRVRERVRDSVCDTPSSIPPEGETPTPEPSKQKTKSKRFVPPTVEEVKQYCQEKGYTFDPERFVNFYNSKNWMVGKNKMTNWKSAAANWNKDNQQRGGSAASPRADPGKNRFNNFHQRENDYDAIQRTLVKQSLE
ncbi:MAG: DUF6291 domain-containing protein [Clostridiales bacterium]|nr:DUF6291 domain-containing protein [Clostridiales bacterium]